MSPEQKNLFREYFEKSLFRNPELFYFLPSPVNITDSFSLNEINILSTISTRRKTRDLVIDPVSCDLRLSIPKINAIPDTWPINISMPFDVPSDAGYVISAPYWNPMGPELRRKNPRTVPENRRSQ
jgi:hypothetical protein